MQVEHRLSQGVLGRSYASLLPSDASVFMLYRSFYIKRIIVQFIGSFLCANCIITVYQCVKLRKNLEDSSRQHMLKVWPVFCRIYLIAKRYGCYFALGRFRVKISTRSPTILNEVFPQFLQANSSTAVTASFNILSNSLINLPFI